MEAARCQSPRRGRRALVALSSLAVAGVLAAGFGSGAASADEVPRSLLGPKTSLAFVRHTATIAGTSAVIAVRCRGPVGSSCTGSLTLNLGRAGHKVAFSVECGERQNLVVPLGRDREHVGKRARAVARTMQPLGADIRVERVLDLR